MNSTTQFVRGAIGRTRDHDPDYFAKCISQRLISGKGSVYPYSDPEELLGCLMRAVWEPYEHPAIAPGCRAFISRDMHLKGYVGMVPLKDLPPDTVCRLLDPKGTGKLSLCVDSLAEKRWPVNFTVLITGDDGYGECMFTFHPGDPVPPSTLSSDGNNDLGLKLNDTVTAAEAMAMGFKHAKIVSE